MFVHPKCPCSRASVAELGRLVARVKRPFAASVVFVKPGGSDGDWSGSGLRESIAAIPGVAIVTDEDGAEAARFGAETSGACVLYDARGRLEFTGGITSMRGHEGDSFGQERMVALLNGETADRGSSPVYGCGLSDEAGAKGEKR
jgi:hypothetical protein